MKFSFFNFFRDEKHNLIFIVLDIRNIPGGHDLFDRVLFVILADILILLILFVCKYIFCRIFAKYISAGNRLFFFNKKKAYCFGKDRPIIKRPDSESLFYIRYRFSVLDSNKRMQQSRCYYTRN